MVSPTIGESTHSQPTSDSYAFEAGWWKHVISVDSPSEDLMGKRRHARHQQIILYRRALQSLSQDERLICIWKKARFSDEEIARELSTAESVVREMFLRAKLKIRRTLTGE